jgi:hypothetical protein
MAIPYTPRSAPAARPAPQPAAAPRREKARGADSGRRGGERPIVAPPPAPAPYVPSVGNEDPPVPVGGEPQVSSGGTAGPEEAPAESGTVTQPAAGTAPAGMPDEVVAEEPVASPSAPATPTPQPGGATPPPEH